MTRHAPKDADSGMMPPATKPRDRGKDAGPMHASHSGMGNAATAGLLEDAAAAKAVPPAVRARMEHSFGLDLRGVRVDESGAARRETDSLDAEAMVRDGQIRWSSTAPPLDSPQAEPLLAHEIAHVVQQKRASSIEDRVSAPGEASEVAAHAAAGRAMVGQNASVAGGGAVAGTQRQLKADSVPKEPVSDPAAATQLLTAYLKKVATTTPPQNIKKAVVVRYALQTLVSLLRLDANSFVDDSLTSPDPATMAGQFVARVPPISTAALKKLENLPFIDPPPSKLARVGDLVSKSGAGGGDIPQPPGYVSPADKAKNIMDIMAAQHGTTVPGGFGPVSVDVGQVVRIFKGLPGAVKPKSTKPAAPQSEDYPAVEAAIAKMPKDALVPAEGKNNPDKWAETAEFANQLARQMDIAQKRKQSQVPVDLGAQYEAIKDRAALRVAVEAIIQQIRDALPHHAADVTFVDVMTGKTILTRGVAKVP